ncbi:MAG TPA: patatin-like phospholipase family protein [Candidatus Dormibacteraeota bacterium]
MPFAPAIDRFERLARPLVLALSGGGANGAAQAGAAAELFEAGFRPDLIIGTSVGAWNGAWLAGHPDGEGGRALLQLWVDPSVRSLLRGVVRGYVGALARRRVAAFSDSHMRRIIDQSFGGRSFDDLRMPLAVAAVDLITAELEYLDSGSLSEAVLAASAIPTVLPPVRIGDRMLADAGFVDNFGIVEALRRGARSIVLLDASVGALSGAPDRLTAMLGRANLVTKIHQRRHAVAAAAAAGVRLDIVEVSALGWVLDFAAAGAHIALGRDVARSWLEAVDGGVPALLQGRLHTGAAMTRLRSSSAQAV